MGINPMDLLKNFQNMGSKLAEMQEKMKSIEAVGTAGGGLVEITINGQLSVTGVKIDREAVNPEDVWCKPGILRMGSFSIVQCARHF